MIIEEQIRASVVNLMSIIPERFGRHAQEERQHEWSNFENHPPHLRRFLLLVALEREALIVRNRTIVRQIRIVIPSLKKNSLACSRRAIARID